MITTPEPYLHYTTMVRYTALGVVKLLIEVPYDNRNKFLTPLLRNSVENLEEIYNMINGGVEYPRTQNASPSEIKEPYEPSPMMYLYEQPSCLGSNLVGETLWKSNQLHQTCKKSSIAITRKLDDTIELPKSCEIVMVKMPKCMAWLDDEPIGDLDTIEDK
ncbi:hypothetical protein Tco_0166494, partial [Tanacetum coccineum]